VKSQETSVSLLQKMLNALKPEHRRGELGKSIETAQGRRLRNLDLDDPNFTTKLTVWTAALVEHYTKQVIGTKGHERGFVLGNVDPIERNLAGLLRQAIKDGNVPAQDLLVQQLEALDSIPKNDLSPKIERLIETVKRKNWRVTITQKQGDIKTGDIHLRPRIIVGIGKRNIFRASVGSTGYGPTLVEGGTTLFDYQGHGQ